MFTAQIYETLSPLNGQVNHNTLAFIRRANVALDKWWQDCDEIHRTFPWRIRPNLSINTLWYRAING